MLDLNENILKNIQANIIFPHGRNHISCLFLQFGFGMQKDKLRKGVSDFFSENKLTSTHKQLEDAKKRIKDETHDGGLVRSFYLTKMGYEKLKVDAADMPDDISFNIGMKNEIIRKKLNDPHFNNWESNYKNSFDGMVLLANKDDGIFEDEKNKIGNFLREKGIGRILFEERGRVIRRGNFVVEPFGYRDGIVNPIFFIKDNNYALESSNIEKINEIAIDLDNGKLGSYLVFRKLEQNVHDFKKKVTEIEKKGGELLKNNTDNTEPIQKAGAHLIGRYEDGKALTKGNNDFDISFTSDPNGLKCPFSAHIRKVNPRNGVDKQIVRRGVPYGIDEFDPNDLPKDGVGLLFMCYQKSIETQFESIQSDWCNNPDFQSKGHGIDSLVGQLFPPMEKNPSPVPVEREGDKLVTLKGGEYFYAPPISFLNSLAE